MSAAFSNSPVGVIGLGRLGLAVAGKLIAAKQPVAGYRRSGMEVFAALGGLPMASPLALAAVAHPVILLLPNDAALAEVVAQITPAMRPGSVVVCLATHRLAAKNAARVTLEATGAVLIDGEVSGTPAMLQAGQASIMLAGDASVAERLLPMLRVVSPVVSYLGAFGNASSMKLVTNYLVGVHTLAAAEALVLAGRLGLDPQKVVETVASSAGGSAMLEVRGRMMAENDYQPGSMAGFMNSFSLLRDALKAHGAESGDLQTFVEGRYRQAIDEGHGGRDIAAIYDSVGGMRPSATESFPA